MLLQQLIDLSFGCDDLRQPSAAKIIGSEQVAAAVPLGLLGLCTIGTLFACMSVRTRFREVLLPILLLPALFPVLAGAVEGTLAVLAGDPLPFAAVQLLVVVDGIYLVIGFLGFDLILDE